MATVRVRFHQNVGPNQVQAPANKISDATPLTLSGSAANTPAVANSCLAELSCDGICAVDYGVGVTAVAGTSQRLPAGTYGYFVWLNGGERVSAVQDT